MLEELTEDLSSIKKIHPETKDTLTETKKNLHGSSGRVDKAKNQINDLEHRKQKTTYQKNKKKKRIQKNEDSISSLWDNYKIIGPTFTS